MADQWTEKVDECTSLEHSSVSITCGDKTIFTSDDQTHEESHQWEITDKQFLGETCYDGVKLNYTCSVCNASETHIAFYHSREDGTLKDYVSSTCDCVNQRVAVCKYCDKVTNIEIFEYAQFNPAFVRKDITDSAGEVIGEKYSFTCPTCQMKYVRETKTVAIDSCHSIVSIHQYVYDAQGQCLLDVLCDEEETTTHKCDYQYYMLGEDCYDGYFAVGTCENCKQTDIFVYGGHVWEDKPIDLSQYGCCQNEISCRKCKVCGEMQPDIEDPNCKFETTDNRYTDDNGVEHVTVTIVCSECGLTLKGEGTITKDGCTSIESYTTTISKGETVVWTMEIEETFASHDYKDEKKYFVGDDCSDGVYIVKSCQCGEQYIEYVSDHQNQRTEIDLASLGFCGGRLNCLSCDICGSEIYFTFGVNCQWGEPTIDTDGYEVYQCAVCHGIRKVKTTETVIDDCHTKVEITYIYQGTIGEPYSYKSSQIEENHDYQYENHLTGETCEDGWTLTGTCSRCGVSYIDSWTRYNHDYNYEYHLTGETCEDGWTATETCSRCGATGEQSSGSYHDYVYKDVSLSEYGFCDEVLVYKICDICGEEDCYTLFDNCQWGEPTTDSDGYVVYQCAVCDGIRKEKISRTVIDDCHTKVETSYIYQGTIGDPYSCKSSRIVEDHDYYNYEYHLTGNTCEDGWTATGTCSRCGATGGASSGSYHAYTVQYVYLNEYGLCGGSLEIGECQICHGKDVFDEADCNWQYKGTNSDGYQVSECSNCHITKLYKNTVSEKANHCYCTYETTIIYRNGTTELYSITAAIKEPLHDYSYTYDPETPDCTNDEWHGYTATCKNCNHTETVWYLGHHVTYFNYIDLGDCGCFVVEGICNVCHEIVKYRVKEYDTCSWEYQGINAEDYDVRVCSECGLIMWTKVDENTYQTEYIFYDKDNKELYRCTT